MRANRLAQAVLAAGLVAGPAMAEENLWVYTKGTDTRPKGSFEFKLSDTIRVGKHSGDYEFHDIRPEIEYGVTDKLTIGAEILIFHHDYSVNDPDLQPVFDTQGGEGGRFKDTQYGGFEVALKYNIYSPYKDWAGLSLGLGYERREQYRLDGADISQNSYTGTVFFQKNWIDDKLTLAVNVKTEFERRKSPGVLEEEISFDFSAGLAYRVAPKHFVGIEYRRQQDHLSPFNTETGEYDDPSLQPSEFDLTNFRVGTRHQYGEYIGPTYHFAEKNWWLTAGILFQVQGGGSEHAFVESSKNWDEHEQYHVGLIYGYEY